MGTHVISPPAGPHSPGPIIFRGKYLLEKVLGKGSYGTATLMNRLEDNWRVVMKTIDLVGMKASDAEFARQEAKASCSHAAVTVLHLGNEETLSL
jgi:hypothetical protein